MYKALSLCEMWFILGTEELGLKQYTTNDNINVLNFLRVLF